MSDRQARKIRKAHARAARRLKSEKPAPLVQIRGWNERHYHSAFLPEGMRDPKECGPAKRRLRALERRG